MVTLIVNGIERKINPADYENFGHLLDVLQKEMPNKVLTALKINGKDIPLVYVDELKAAKLDENNLTIEMEYSSVKDFLITTLKDIIAYIDKVIDLLPEVSEKMVVDTEKAYKDVQDLSEGLSAIQELQSNTSKMSGVSMEETGITEEEQEEAVNILKKFVDNLENRDVIELSDALEYEIPKVLKLYRRYFEKVRELLMQRGS